MRKFLWKGLSVFLSGRNRRTVAKGKSFAVRMEMLMGKLHEQGDEFEEVREGCNHWRFVAHNELKVPQLRPCQRIH